MSSTSKAGIKTSADGSSYIPSSTRADGSTRKEIRVRPGYRPPEDVETYKNRSAEAWKNRGGGGVPGADESDKGKDSEETKGKNAKRREAAKKKKEVEATATTAEDGTLNAAMDQIQISSSTKVDDQLAKNSDLNTDLDVERQKKIRNQLKKLRAVRELREKKASGEKLSHDQLLKIGKEDELLRDLKKLNYDGPEMSQASEIASTTVDKAG